MGNQNSEIDNDQFRKSDWEERQKFPQFQVWKSKTQPVFRLEQYQICTQNDEELRHVRKVFELRRRNPLLVAAYYFQSYPKDNFCSLLNRHSLFLQRIPIRLEDVEHVPFPDYLHLFDACLKGFAQLARWAGFFPVEEGMVGINQQGIVKVWLNEDLPSTRPFGRATEQQMVSSLIEAIDRNIDHDLLPPSTPTVRNFLYRNADALTFDAAIREFGEFVHNFNSGQVPIRLECIDQAGGVYAIANRDQSKPNLKKSDVRRSQVKANSTFRSNQKPGLASLPVIVTSRLPPIASPPIKQSQAYYASQPVQIQPQVVQVPIMYNSAQPIFFDSRKQIDPSFAPRASNALKFTVEVTPGKVYPQKSSTIFMNGSSKIIPTDSKKQVPIETNEVSLFEKIHPRFATSEKEVGVEGLQSNVKNSTKQDIVQIHEEVIPQAQVTAGSAPNSKRSITQVILDNQSSDGPATSPPIPEQTTPNNDQNSLPLQFKEAVSVPQETIPNSLLVSFNPAYKSEAVNVKNSGSEQFGSNLTSSQQYTLSQSDAIRETGKFIDRSQEQPAQRQVETADVSEDALIRETGKFNLYSYQTSANPQYENQYFDNNDYQHHYFGESYNNMGLNGGDYHDDTTNIHSNGVSTSTKTRLQELTGILNFDTEAAQIDLPASYYTSYNSHNIYSYSSEFPPASGH